MILCMLSTFFGQKYRNQIEKDRGRSLFPKLSLPIAKIEAWCCDYSLINRDGELKLGPDF